MSQAPCLFTLQPLKQCTSVPGVSPFERFRINIVLTVSQFLPFLSFSPGTRRVHANEVYQEYIKDKNHLHMNATRVSLCNALCVCVCVCACVRVCVCIINSFLSPVDDSDGLCDVSRQERSVLFDVSQKLHVLRPLSRFAGTNQWTISTDLQLSLIRLLDDILYSSVHSVSCMSISFLRRSV